jgi:hypothetical protein
LGQNQNQRRFSGAAIKLARQQQHFIKSACLLAVLVLCFQNCTSPFQAAGPALVASDSLPIASPSSSPIPAVVVSDVFNVINYGAHGDGVTDDTHAIQATINAAEAQGGIVFFPVGSFIISSNLSITSGITVRGLAYTGAFTNFKSLGSTIPSVPLSSLEGCSCIVQTNPTASVFYATTTDAIEFQDLVIYYKSAAPYSGATGIQVNGGNNTGNSQSLVRDVLIYGADRGITFTNAASWVVDNTVIYNSQTYGLIHDASFSTGSVAIENAASTGDWQISNTTFASSIGNNAYAHIYLAGGGGGRIVENTMTASGIGYGILIGPANYVTPSTPSPNGFNIEPVVVTNNIIQGTNYGIAFIGAPGTNGTSTLGVITDNQISANTDIYSQAGIIVPQWVDGWTIYGNTFNCLGGAGAYCINMDGASGINITANTFHLGSGAEQLTRFGATTAAIQFSSNNTSASGTSQANFNGLGVQSIARATSLQGLISYSPAATFNVFSYGAHGDGVTDDTQAIQSAINAAEAGNGTVFFPAGKFIISAPLSITSSVTVQGIGYQSAGTNFITTNGGAFLVPESALHGCSCIIQTNPSQSIFVANTTETVQFLDLELFYATLATPFSGAAGISISGGNSSSLMRDIFIQGADRGIVVVDSAAWVVDNVFIYNSQTYGILEDGTAANSSGWEIINCTFATGTGSNYSHIILLGGGGGQIVGNKLNAAGNGTQSLMNGIAIAPSASHYTSGGFQMGPLSIVGNSIEGEFVGIAFTGAPGNDAISTSGLIMGNQVWANTDIYAAAGPVYPEWIQDWTISGNLFNSQGGPSATYNINMDGASGVSITGNTYTTVLGGTTPSYFGPNTSSIQSTDNLVDY